MKDIRVAAAVRAARASIATATTALEQARESSIRIKVAIQQSGVPQ